MALAPPFQHWFLVRGLARESAHWGEFPEKFRQSLPRVQVHCLDLPGSGKRNQEKSPWRLKQIADSVRSEFHKTLAEKNIPDSAPKFLLAISLGGMVATHWLSRAPNDFQGAVLVNASLRGFSPLLHRLSPKGYRRLLAAIMAQDPMERERWILELTSQARSWTEADLRERVLWSKKHPFTYENFLRQLVAAATDFPPSAKPECPILVLNSLGDELVHPDCSMDIHRRWQVPIKRHAWAGHDLPLDDPQWTIEAIRAWMLENNFIYAASLQKVAKPLLEE
jgi:pimeloyl-ACP methyl ester carboxylesterase